MPEALDDALGIVNTPIAGEVKNPENNKPLDTTLGGAPVSFRRFNDTGAMRQAIFDRVQKAVSESYPKENDRYALQLTNVRYSKPKEYTLADQKQALNRGQSLYWPLKGTWSLLDKANNKVVEQKESVVAHVPYATQRGTFIQKGSEYTVTNQMRLRPGVYARQKESGELEAHFNVKPGTGVGFKIEMEPATGIFRMNAGQASLKLYPILKAMGVTDKALESAWGRDLVNVNRESADSRALFRAYKKLAQLRTRQEIGENPTAADMGSAIRDAFERMELDEETTSSTLGKGHKNVTTDTLIGSAQKLLKISRQEAETDDRDSLAFQTFHTPDDFFEERVRKDAGNVGKKLLWKVTNKGNLASIPSSALNDQMQAVFLSSGLAQPLEEINPLEINDQMERVVRLGEGGMGSLDVVPADSRNVQPSHFMFIDPIRGPESAKLGIDSRITRNTVKGSDGKIYTRMLDKSGKERMIDPVTAASSIVAFPGEMARKTKKVRAMIKGKTVGYVDRKEVDFVAPSSQEMFGAGSNLVPMISAIKGGRLLMGGKISNQALPLEGAESPLVQGAVDDFGDMSFEDELGERVGAVRATGAGKVISRTKDHVTVKYNDGSKKKYDLYNNFGFNRKTFIHNTPVVNVGDTVKPGDLIARSNYTDDKGTLAVGKNLRTAYVSYKGYNYDDGIVISESAAKKLSSEHMYNNEMDVTKDIITGKNPYISRYPGKFNREQLDRMDDNGVIKVGTKVSEGDPLILGVKKLRPSATLMKGARKDYFGDNAVTWDHRSPGVVTDVEKSKNGWNVSVKAYSPMKLADKLSGRYGDKGTIAKIVPDDRMLRDKDGKPFDVLLSPLGIISRVNPAQMIEAQLAKIARKTGKPYKMPSFSDDSYIDFVRKELAKHGLKDTEDVFDPEDGDRKIPKVFTGERFMMKLHHTAESKGAGRGSGAYTSENVPAKGGPTGAKRIGGMEISALVSHGASEVLRDAKIVRGQRNDDYWKAFKLGLTPKTPGRPFVYDKFLASLQAAGINVDRDGDNVNIFAMTNDDVKALTSHKIENAETLDQNTLKPIPGGLFDYTKTGGPAGNRFAYIQLKEAIPNPVMEDPIRYMLGLTKNKYRDVIAGKELIEGNRGAAAIKHALQKLNVDKEIEKYRTIISSGKKSARNNAVKTLKYLEYVKRKKLRPADFMLDRVPVLPPVFRPVTQMDNGVPLVSDPNYLYKDLFDANKDYEAMSKVVDDDQLTDERMRVYDAFRAVSGLGDPVNVKTQEKGVRGILKNIFGGSPKFGMFQRRVLGMAVDTVGRSVISPNPKFNMDEVGLPINQAWEIYQPFVIRDMVKRGHKPTDAVKHVKNKSDQAFEALQRVTGERPLIINRAPTLHRYSMMAAWPKLVKGDTLQISPVVTPGFGADFDGDTMQYHVPVSQEAVMEAVDKMMPSRNLLSTSDFRTHYHPRMEYLQGLYFASKSKTDKAPRVFRNKVDIIRAFKNGEIALGDRIKL